MLYLDFAWAWLLFVAVFDIVHMFRNIVSTVNLDCKLDLKAIALQARNAEYNPKVCERL